jgi:glyoxylase-like metal-dependent hydrolase (beta-lactamase superfamily II)
MTGSQRCFLIGLAAALLSACGTAPNTAELAADMAAGMGGSSALENISSVVLRGHGSRTRMGQIPATGAADPTGELIDLTETIDLAGARAAFDYGIVNGDFTQRRTEVYTRYRDRPVAWATTEGRANSVTSPNGLFSWATQNSPETLLRRNVITVALAALATASSEQIAETRELDGRDTLYGTANLPSGEQIGLYFDPTTHLLAGFSALDTETMLGDVAASYILGDYRATGDVLLPHALRIDKQDRLYAEVQYSSIELNDAGALGVFEVPADVVAQAEQVIATDESWAPLNWMPVAPAVYHAVGFSHNSMIVEFATFVVVVEAPYTEAQGLTLGRAIQEQLGKPIRYVVPSHPHYDHTGGIRALAALGATVLVAAGHETELRALVESPHTLPADTLARRRAVGEPVGEIQTFAGMTTIEEGAQRLELYEVTTIAHVNPKTLAYVPNTGALFQSDLFFGAASSDARALYDAIEERKLDVTTIVGGHGGSQPFDSLVQAVGGN